MSVDPEDFIDQRVLILGRGTCMHAAVKALHIWLHKCTDVHMHIRKD